VSKVRVSIVVAVARNGVIGRNGSIPWKLSADLKSFRSLTLGKPVVMGRKTWESLPRRPLDQRDNIVISRNSGYEAPGAEVVPSYVEAIVLAERRARARQVDEILVIGGAQIYALALAGADRVYLTRIDADIPGDATFPSLDLDQWREARREPLPASTGDTHAGELIIFDRSS